ncbi:type VI secretion system secreted protein VgrG [Massilia sp. UYP32]|uniref:Type VI secretion system Vgr family protein n=1 Tax=Massilia timonae CCUG 45783 TaxID=883126 RepID=K9DZ62_9BURK|nr:type VI secretion system Vgr family protein [Massilia timonae]EKU82515.1 type VI secretion system Vgr family protein [Massilia timonae CCUG 45783]
MGEIQAIAAGAARSAFSGASQHNRIMRLDFPFEDGPPAILLPNKLKVSEAVSRCFRIVVEALSDDPQIPLKIVMGKMVTISLVREDGSLRYFNGYVTEFRFVRSDGGFAFYQMVLEPWLAFTRLRKNSMSFHNKSVREITEDTLKHYRPADWHMYPVDESKLTVANQYNETDYNHLHRRWEALGLHYWYEHEFGRHKLMISDNSFLAEPIDEEAYLIPFHDKGGSREDDGIHEWTAIRRLGPGQVTLASTDYKNPGAQRASVDSGNQQGDVFPYEIYEDTGAYGFRMRSDGEQLAARRMEEQDKNRQYFEAAGNDRSVLPGRTFKLGDHFSAEPRSPEYDPEPRRSIGDRRYLILDVEHEATNNYQAGVGAPSQYENRFTCIRKDIRWRPGPGFNSAPGTNMGLHTAAVVGPAGADIHTDGYGRVKLQFPWDRLGKYDENSSPWIRVMTPAAGNEFGQVRLPRVGEEVGVVYSNGNIDHPLILGAVYNGKHMPPWKLPEQSALAGLRSRELGGGSRGNHLILDDTKEQIQAQLKSDHQCSQLSLGHITRIEDTSGRKDARGEGWELTTNAWGVARAAQGMLITTEARLNAASHAKDLGETAQRLASAAQIQEQLAAMALDHEAQESGQQDEAAEDVKAQNSAIRGAAKGSSPELSEPHLVMASPAGIELTSAQSTHIASERHTAITSGKSLSLASVDSLFASVGKTFRLFVHKAGMKLIAAAGKVSVQAQTDDVEIIANKVLEMISDTEWVNIRGKKGIRMYGGGKNMVEIGEQVQFFTAAPVLFHGNLETLPPKSVSQAFNERSRDYQFDQEVNFVDANLKPEKAVAYELVRGDGTVMDGKTAASGSTEVQKSGGFDSYTIRYKGELP